MIYAKLDVDFYDHPRFVKAGLAAIGLWACSLAYCRKHAFNADHPGRFPKDVDFIRRAGGAAAASKLVDVGLWIDRGDDYELHNYEAKNETKDDIEVRRDLDRERQRRFREDRKRSRDASRDNHDTSHQSSSRDVGGGVTGSGSSLSSSGERVQGEGAPAWTRDPFGAQSLGEAWRNGVSMGGGRVTAPSRSETARIVAAVDAHAPDSAKVGDAHGERGSWVLNRAAEWAETKPARVSVFAWVDWLNGDRRDTRTTREALPEAPPPPARDFSSGPPISDADRARFAAELEAAASGVGGGGS